VTQVRFGLLGTGYWAVRTHGTALSGSERADLVGIWGRDPAKAGEAAERLGTTAYHDLDDLLGSVDAVAIAVPPDVQARLAVEAARAGCHVLLDKPLALDVVSAEAVVRAVDEAGVASVVFFTARFHPETERWSEAAAEVAPWHSAHFFSYNNIFEPGGHYAGSAWRHKYGALWDVGPHAFAALVPIMGPVHAVAARRGPAGSDTVHVVVTHGRSQLAAPSGLPAGASVAGASVGGASVAGASGTGASDNGPAPGTSTFSVSLSMPTPGTGRALVLYGERGVWARPEADIDPVPAFRVAIDELAALVATGERRHRCDARFGLYVVRALAAAEKALELPAVELPVLDVNDC
jgi:predicted dehydrogenase